MNADNLQRAIFSALNDDPVLGLLITGVYADVQQPAKPEDDSAFPYVVIGQDNLSPWDTKTNLGGNAICQVDVWSRSNNFLEAKEVGGAVHDALHYGTLDIDRADHTMTTAVSANYTTDPDGHTKRGVMLFRVLYDDIF